MSDHFLSAFVFTRIVAVLAIFQGVQAFIFFYPLFMSFIWSFGAIYYYFHWERESQMPDEAPDLPATPMVSIVVPCFNEEPNVRETIGSLLGQEYPAFSTIAE